MVLDERIYAEDYMNANLHKLFVFQLLEDSGISYDQILIADADTIIHPQSPSPFDVTDHKSQCQAKEVLIGFVGV